MSLTGILKDIFAFIYTFTHNYGLTIIVFTVLVRVVLLPFFFKQFHSTKKMSELQPLMTKLQEKYKNDKEKLNEKVMELYKEKGVNPLGCGVPMIITMIILWPLYGVLRTYSAFKGVDFLWLSDLSAPDHSYILPILIGITNYAIMITGTPPSSVSQKQQSQNKNMSIIMSIIMVWFTYNLPSGLGIYWAVSNIFQFAQQLAFIKILYKKDESEASVGLDKNRDLNKDR